MVLNQLVTELADSAGAPSIRFRDALQWVHWIDPGQQALTLALTLDLTLTLALTLA